MKNAETTKKVGNFGEDAATRFLRKRFYKILDRNYTVGKYEIDIIAESLRHLVFIEVKTRTQDPQVAPKYGTPSAAVTHTKRSYLISAARQYLLMHPSRKTIRFDVIEIYLSPEESTKILKIQHMKDAFRAY